jgi:hypothetical protein
MRFLNKKIGLLLSTIFFSNIAVSSNVVFYNGKGIGMPIPPNNYNLSWNKSSGISSEQYVCLVGYKKKSYYDDSHCDSHDYDKDSYSSLDDDDHECSCENNTSNNINTYHDDYDDNNHTNYRTSPINVELRAFGLNTKDSMLGQFTMRNRNNDFLKYKMEFYNYNNNSYKKLQQNVFVKNIKGVTNCDNDNAYKQKIKITVDLDNLQNAPSGTYWDLVYLASGKNNQAYAQDLYYVSITIEGGRIQVNQLDDINFGIYRVGQGDLSITEQFCVHQSPASTYNLSIYDTHPESGDWKFNLDSGNQAIPYKVFYRTTSTGFYPVNNGSTMGSFKSNEVVNCTNSETANTAERAYIKIEISESDLLKSVPELYKGTLYITASPE